MRHRQGPLSSSYLAAAALAGCALAPFNVCQPVPAGPPVHHGTRVHHGTVQVCLPGAG